MKPGRFWLGGRNIGRYYLLDVRSGRYVRSIRLPGDVRVAAGLGGRCGRTTVSLYLASPEDVVLQVGRKRFPVDGRTLVRSERILRGLGTRMVVTRPGGDAATVETTNLLGAFSRRFDPTWDDLDDETTDWLADMADTVNDPERVALVRLHNQYDADPRKQPRVPFHAREPLSPEVEATMSYAPLLPLVRALAAAGNEAVDDGFTLTARGWLCRMARPLDVEVLSALARGKDVLLETDRVVLPFADGYEAAVEGPLAWGPTQ